MCVTKENMWRWGNKVGLFFVLAFLGCFAWYYIHPVEQSFHLSSLRLAFFGFSGMNGVSFIAGLVQSYIWGYLAVIGWYLVGLCCGDKGMEHHS